MDIKTIEKLEEKFPENLIKINSYNGLSYIQWTYIKKRLDDVLDGNWSFEVVSVDSGLNLPPIPVQTCH